MERTTRRPTSSGVGGGDCSADAGPCSIRKRGRSGEGLCQGQVFAKRKRIHLELAPMMALPFLLRRRRLSRLDKPRSSPFTPHTAWSSAATNILVPALNVDFPPQSENSSRRSPGRLVTALARRRIAIHNCLSGSLESEICGLWIGRCNN